VSDYGFVGRIPLDVMVLCLSCGYAHMPKRHGEPILIEVPKDELWFVNPDGSVAARIVNLGPEVDKP
jgi:hypothetical protein